MDYTEITTRFLGVVFTLYGLTLLFKRARVMEAHAELCSNKGLSFAVGMMQIFWGAFIVVQDEVWAGWSLLTTVAGWVILLIGMKRLWCSKSYGDKCVQGSCGNCAVSIIGLITLAWGLLMVVFGFFGGFEGLLNAF